jgi:GNAT superfamily N-acetyltransferase
MSTDTIMTRAGALSMRPEAADGSDEAFLFALFASHKLAEMAFMPLDDAGKEQLLRIQYRSMSASYRIQYPDARFEIVLLDGVPAGRLVTDVNAERVYYVDIAMLPTTQGAGVATALMNAVLKEPRRLGIPGRVQVLSGNAASLRLCEKVGMAVVGQEPPFVVLEYPAVPAA